MCVSSEGQDPWCFRTWSWKFRAVGASGHQIQASKVRGARNRAARVGLWRRAWWASFSSSESGVWITWNIPPTLDFLIHKPQGAPPPIASRRTRFTVALWQARRNRERFLNWKSLGGYLVQRLPTFFLLRQSPACQACFCSFIHARMHVFMRSFSACSLSTCSVWDLGALSLRGGQDRAGPCSPGAGILMR